MLSYKFSSSIFLRSPACSYETFDTGKLRQILDSPFFRLALYLASRGLYMQVQLKGFDVGLMGTGMRESLLKYYNRICYRTTPFGIFSAFSLVRWGTDTGGLTMHKKERVHLLPDFEFMEKIAAGIHAGKPSDILCSDPGIYQAGKELRYLKRWKDDRDHPDTGITGVESSRLLKKIIHKARQGISREELRQFLKQYYDDEDAGELTSELEAEKLLLNQALLNVTGENYLRRIGKQYGERKIREFAGSLESPDDTAHITVDGLEHLLEPFAGNFEELKSPFYVNYERKVSGCIDEHFQEVLRFGLFALSKLQVPAVNASLERFKANFLSAYDGREGQLMTVLDPEFGIGYEQQEDISEKDEILRGIVFHDHAAAKQISWGPVQELLMNKIMNCSKGESLILTDHELERLPGIKDKQLPPGISVMFRTAGDQLLIEDVGGACATSLIGRFTSVSDKVLEYAVKLAEDEQQVNPDIVFAEIAAYSADTHATNINTRRHIRQYEIPVMVHSTLPPERVIRLNDLYVSVQQDEIILRSLSLNKRVIPRLSSAYNYARSELPVFRFLCDLQYQGLAPDFTLRPEKLLPGLSHCPRIEYKNCILQEAFWVLKARDIKEIADMPAFLKFAKQRHITRYFAISQSDRQLVFDLEDPGSIRMFLEETAKAGDLVLKEFFVPPAGNALLKDLEGKGYIHQMVATLTRTVKSYFQVPLYRPVPARITRYFFPGDKWIYFKIYCAPQYASEVISRWIYPLMKRCSSRPGFGKWFFVRYYDPEPHLRVRIQADPVLLETMPGLVNKALRPFLKNGLIRRLQLDTYAREIERYGADAMEQAETVFMSSSELVAEYIRKERNEEEMIQFAVRSVHEIFRPYNLDLDEKIGILEQVCKKLMSEWDHEKQLKADLDKKYREYQHKIAGFISGKNVFSAGSESALLKKLTGDIFLLNQCFDGSNKSRVIRSVSDILHMHMNRIFNSGQRKRELLIYYLCLRFYLSFRARQMVKG